MFDIENGVVYRTTRSTSDSVVKYGLNPEKILKNEETETETIYKWTKFNIDTEKWEADATNNTKIEIDSIEYTPIDGTVTITIDKEE